MSAEDTRRVIDRMANAYRAHGDNGGAYLLVALSILADHDAAIVNFILDRADDVSRRWVA